VNASRTAAIVARSLSAAWLDMAGVGGESSNCFMQ
jgi:hypothetical protein